MSSNLQVLPPALLRDLDVFHDIQSFEDCPTLSLPSQTGQLQLHHRCHHSRVDRMTWSHIQCIHHGPLDCPHTEPKSKISEITECLTQRSVKSVEEMQNYKHIVQI